MRRNNYEEAYSFWVELLPITKAPELKAELYDNIAQCCVILEKWEEAEKAVTRALSLYANLGKGYNEDTDRLSTLQGQIMKKARIMGDAFPDY